MTESEGALRAMLGAWLPPNDAPDRPQMQVATVDETGSPDARTVLLSEWDDDGFVFHTDSTSRKADQLRGSPAVALVVLWPGFTRQLVVQGVAEVADRDRLDRAYARRSPYLRQLAWQNTMAVAQLEPTERIDAWRRFTDEHAATEPEAPDTWIGYLVRPHRVTFWQSDPEGPSHRVEFRRSAQGEWTEHHLPG